MVAVTAEWRVKAHGHDLVLKSCLPFEPRSASYTLCEAGYKPTARSPGQWAFHGEQCRGTGERGRAAAVAHAGRLMLPFLMSLGVPHFSVPHKKFFCASLTRLRLRHFLFLREPVALVACVAAPLSKYNKAVPYDSESLCVA